MAYCTLFGMRDFDGKVEEKEKIRVVRMQTVCICVPASVVLMLVLIPGVLDLRWRWALY
jgi:hypothetical protein